MKRRCMLALLALTLSSCTTLSPVERARLEELKYQGVKIPREETKSAFTAGALNILPGVGNFYLAAGDGDGQHWLYGFLNLLTWPLSVVWGVPEAAIDAGAINQRNTILYYTYGPGKKELEKRETAPALKAPPVSSAEPPTTVEQ